MHIKFKNENLLSPSPLMKFTNIIYNVKFAWMNENVDGSVFASQEVYIAQLNPLPKNKQRKRNSSLTQEWPKTESLQHLLWDKYIPATTQLV